MAHHSRYQARDSHGRFTSTTPVWAIIVVIVLVLIALRAFNDQVLVPAKSVPTTTLSTPPTTTTG